MKKILSLSHMVLLSFRCFSFRVCNVTISTLPLLAAILLVHSKIAEKVIR
ncbi:MAG: hypothetical protein PQJ47_11830 [Sphaerochaetaceae bacterium]|nr:hypothetical protein [Sphaerochaetaceae bacterium]